MYNIASELYNNFLEFSKIYYDEYNELSDDKRNKMDPKDKPEELFLKEYNFDGWSDTTRKSKKKKNRLMQQKLMKHLMIYHKFHNRR